MMSDLYYLQLEELRREIKMKGARPSLIDNHIEALLAEGGDELMADLLLVLSDDSEYHEGMFSLVHAAESLDVPPFVHYVRTLLSIFPMLLASAPRWTSIVLMRVMNSDATRHELIRQLRDTPKSVKSAVREMCDQINEASPEFLSKTTSVLIATS